MSVTWSALILWNILIVNSKHSSSAPDFLDSPLKYNIDFKKDFQNTIFFTYQSSCI